MRKKYLAFVVVGAFVMQGRAQDGFKKITSRHFKNLYQLNDSLYRSEQPSKKGFHELEDMGIKTILNFRRLKDDNKKARGTKLILKHMPFKSKELDQKDVLNALRFIQSAQRPILIHCWHGSDRTGAIAAAYRVVFENWPKEKAIQELRMEQFGHHENWYPNIIEVIKNLDVDEVKRELGM